MRFRIIAFTLFALFLPPPAIADVDFQSIGGMRSLCKTFLDNVARDAASYMERGMCIGWAINERSIRTSACILLRDDTQLPPQVKRPGDFAKILARNTARHFLEAQVQAFVNWADDNPQLWSSPLMLTSIDIDFWSEFPCEAAN